MIWRRCSLFDLPAQLLLLLPSLGHAYPNFTSPVAGATVDLPTIVAQWNDTGTQPLISELTSYTLNLMMGGNDEKTMHVLNTFSSDGIYLNSNDSGSGSLSAGAAGALHNGFFFQLVSTTAYDTQIYTYSDRFSIRGLTGSNSPVYINAVNALSGSSEGPPPTGVSTSATPSATETGTQTNTGSAAIVTASTTSGLGSTSSTQSSSSSSGSGSHLTKLSEGAEIGIGVAFGMAGTAVFAIALFCLWRRSRARQQQPRVNDTDDPMAKPELPAEEPQRKVSTRIGFRQLAEADEGVPMSEMDDMTAKFELEGDMPPLVEAGSGRLSVSSDAVSTECGTLSSHGSYTLPPDTPRPPVSPRPPGYY